MLCKEVSCRRTVIGSHRSKVRRRCIGSDGLASRGGALTDGVSSLALSTHMRVMATVLELAALKIIPETYTQSGLSHRLTTELAQTQGHGDLFRARLSILIFAFPLTFYP